MMLYPASQIWLVLGCSEKLAVSQGPTLTECKTCHEIVARHLRIQDHAEECGCIVTRLAATAHPGTLEGNYNSIRSIRALCQTSVRCAVF
ncbi:hypothetical protein BKA82DRAFT_315104 [Pisolithus tinctorius]|uniref:Uncharacterized protein n=1 Tax=Pisolithus tinctorius Marx 270 TaxID=870435 RepID=A0A0C3IEM4_PISTI|nr:hypothetical protein BKA82DRAFT_315104 [Pisolithus tinctorius]KIN95477.1 hypothetical protein M404DRAFT_315104 [Pisolithus tinctorius Marx 270]